MMWNPLGMQEAAENLKDAGCNMDIVDRFLVLLESGSYSEQQKLLRSERTRLLDALHMAQKRIDCLDYLIYQLQKHHNERGTSA